MSAEVSEQEKASHTFEQHEVQNLKNILSPIADSGNKLLSSLSKTLDKTSKATQTAVHLASAFQTYK